MRRDPPSSGTGTAASGPFWNPAYAMLTHAAAGLDLPVDVGMASARHGVHVEACRSDGAGYALLRLGPYTQVRHAAR
ncbi:hypothetical protein [Streptomyces sp. NPDC054786]